MLADDLLGINDEQRKEGQEQMMKFSDEKKSRREGDFNGVGFRGRSNCGVMQIKIEMESRSGHNHGESDFENATNKQNSRTFKVIFEIPENQVKLN